MKKRVGVIGGGISGLCVAHRLRRSGIDVVLFEKGAKVGGNIISEIRDGFLFEHGPNSALASRELLNLIDELGLSDEIVKPDPNSKKRFIVRGGQLVALPSKLVDLAISKAFSNKAKLRLLREPFVRGASTDNESVASFFERRLGKEIVDYAVDPFISGIYAGDPKLLSIKHAFPKLFDFEKNYGGLLKGSIFSKKDKTQQLPKGTPRSITFKSGMQAFPNAIARDLGDAVHLQTNVKDLRKDSAGRYIIQTESGELLFDSIVISTPARAAGVLAINIDAALSAILDEIYYAPVTVVVTVFKAEHVGADPSGFGFLVPSLENRRILGSLWTSSVFGNRAPGGYHLFTTFIGGSRNTEVCRLSEEEILAICLAELDSLMKLTGKPVLTFVKKWERAIPQYNIGYETVVDAVERSQDSNKGFFICSNFYKGISVGDCVKSSITTAGRVIDYLKQ